MDRSFVAVAGFKAPEAATSVADRYKVSVSVPETATRSEGDGRLQLVSMSAVAACGLRGLAKNRAWRRRSQREQRLAKVTRKLFGNMEQLNPFYESPEKQTQKRYEPQVQAINALEETMKAKSDDDLRALTADLQQRAQSGTALEELLPEAFALVREGSTRVLGLRHFDVQMMGGIALHEGNIAEMGTGEGKTLVAILAAFLNALSGKGVHVVTVNDYLARRDAEWVGQPLRFLGMTVGVVQNGMPPDQKKKAYRCDVTYVTNSELGFDYLRDQMAPSPSELALREQSPFNFAVVDEVDSILIDEARTPLIISGVAENTPTKYKVAQEVVRALKKEVHYTVDEKQRQCVLIEGGVEAAEKLLGKDDLFDPEDPWFPFITNALNAKELYIKDKAYIVKRGEVMIVDEFTGRVMEGRRWSNGLHQAIEAKENVQIQAESVTLASISYQSLFRLFDKLSGMTGTAFTEAKEFEEVYKLKTVVVPPNLVRKREDKDDQVYVDDIGKWKAVAREVENAHRIGRPCLIGTTNVENSEIIAELLDALGVAYQLLNAKPENVARETEIVASSGRKYAVTIATNMAGRGTDILLGGNPSMMARLRLREELYSKLFPRKSWAMPEEFYPVDLTPELESQVQKAVSQTVEAWKPKENNLKPTSLEAAEQIVEQGRLTELDAEERLSLACEKAPTDDEVILLLREAYKALAAHYKQITDLEKDEVRALGGLLVLGTERHESRRIDNQLRGRCARQGDPGATRFFLSLNDTIFRIFGGDNIKKMMSMMSLSQPDDVPLESGLLSNSLEEAQKKVENYFYSVRKNVFEYDDVMDTQRKIVYGLRRRALLDPDEDIRATMVEFSDRNMEDFATGHINASKPVNEWLLEKLAENVKVYCSLLDHITPEKLNQVAGSGGPSGAAAVTAYLQEEAQKAFYRKLEMIEGAGPGLTAMVTRQVLLMQLDTFWQQHLKNMDFMKTGMTLRAYGQKNPLTEYKLEGYQVFLKMMSKIRRNGLYNVFLFQPRKLTPMSRDRVKEMIPNREARRRQVKEIKESEAYKLEKEARGVAIDKGAAARSMNLARLSLNVRQVLEAREGLGELALASFSELKDTFARSGLLTLGDQLVWAQACSEFELLEDELHGEVYIGLVGRMEPQAAKAPPETDLEDMDNERFEERQREAQKLFESAQQDPNFVQTLAAFSEQPELFLKELKAASQEQGWTREDVQKMKETYAMMGINLEVMLQEMRASADVLPAAQRELVDYMQQMLTDPDSVLGENAKDTKSEKVDA